METYIIEVNDLVNKEYTEYGVHTDNLESFLDEFDSHFVGTELNFIINGVLFYIYFPNDFMGAIPYWGNGEVIVKKDNVSRADFTRLFADQVKDL